MSKDRDDITRLLGAWQAGDAGALEELTPYVYAELQRLIRLIYPFMRKELCLKWDYADIDDVTTQAIEALLQPGLGGEGAHQGQPLFHRAHSGDGQMLARACGKTSVHSLEPEDLAALALFLAGPGAARITGQAISVNGGISAM